MMRRKFGGQTPSGSREKFILVLTSKSHNSMKNGSTMPNLDRNGIYEVALV